MGDDGWTTQQIYADLKKDLMARLDKQDTVLLDIDRKVDNKVDRIEFSSFVSRYEQRHDNLKKEIDDLKNNRLQAQSVHDHKRRTWATVGVIASLCASFAIAVASILVVH